jgi:V8-like Glu-specific endopeptidase
MHTVPRAAVRSLVGAVLLAGIAWSAGTPPAAARDLPVARSFDGLPVVGALFPAEGGAHTCTATVVHSPRHDLLLTAGHCVAGTGAGLHFVPMLERGRAPYGTWTVVAVHADPRWVADQDPRADYAFLTVAPRDEGGREVRIEDVVGARPVAVWAAYPRRAVVVGYPAAADDDRPVTCTTRTYSHDGYPAFDCDGYTEGTSGGPWFTRDGAVFGVIGGPHQGGCVAWTSYSSRFGSGVAVAYLRAVLGLPGDVLPEPGGDGC